jgi:hypothetical protein
MCWAPYGLLILLDYGDQMPREVYMYTTQLGHSYSAMNMVLYYFFNPSFKKQYILLARKFLLKPVNSTTEGASTLALSTVRQRANHPE